MKEDRELFTKEIIVDKNALVLDYLLSIFGAEFYNNKIVYNKLLEFQTFIQKYFGFEYENFNADIETEEIIIKLLLKK